MDRLAGFLSSPESVQKLRDYCTFIFRTTLKLLAVVVIHGIRQCSENGRRIYFYNRGRLASSPW